VSRHVRAWIEGAMAGGVMATAKHFPGHGRTTLDSHEVLPDVQLDLEQLFDTDLMPFRAAIAAGVGAVMTAHVAFPQWDGSGMPATLSPTILSFLRDELGFTGLVVTDALIMEGALNGRHESDVSVDALRAGCDALLYPRDPVGLIYAIDRAAAAATFAIEASVERVTAAAVQSRPMDDFVGAADRAEFAAALADLALHTLRDGPLVLEDTITVSVVDDDVGGPYRVGPRDLFERTLRARGVASGRGSKITLIFSEPRSWKGRAGFGESTIAALGREIPGSDLVLLFGPPRLATAIPGDMPVVCAWHGQPLMQEAAARWVLDRLR
ncbi:MAG: glycoside hydrolase family 3 N-terminal domain-containing protein, partial [Gemmatimonadales bacterium]